MAVGAVAGACTEVSAGGGVLRVFVDGLAIDASGAGEAVISGGMLARPITVVLPASAVHDEALAAGTYTVTYRAPAGYALAAGSAATDTVEVSAGATTEVSFRVVLAAVPSGILFHSEWGTALGTGDDAVLDSSAASPWSFRGSGCEVVDATGLGFPTAHCLRVGWSDRLFNFVRKSGLPVIAVGATRHYRWYERVVWPDDTADDQVHPHQDGYSGGIHNWMLLYFNGPGTFTVQLWGGDNNDYPTKRYLCGVSLNKNQTYRFEIALTRTSETRYRLAARIHDAGDVLVASNDDFVQEDSGGAVTLTNMPELTFFAVENTDGFNMGCNDSGGEAGDFAYQAAVAIGDGDWIGPYADGV